MTKRKDPTRNGRLGERSLPPKECPAGAVWVPLTGGLFALVDASDASRVLKHLWCAYLRKRKYTTTYATFTEWLGGGKSRHWKLHRFVLGFAGASPQVDHRNGNGLDCRRANLRICSNAQNQANRASLPHTSRFKGVSWDKRAGKWFAKCSVGGRQVNLGLFDDEEAAARAYNGAHAKAFGEFARLNEVE